jgi:TonB family protein
MFACNPSKNSKGQASEASGQPILSEEPAAEPAASSESEAIPFADIERKPTFNGVDANEFSVWVNAHLTYPEQAKKDGAQGRVVLQFIVGADGAVRDVKVLKSVREDLDAEAVRVISSSPKWEPGLQDGKAVPVIYNFPIVFQLK